MTGEPWEAEPGSGQMVMLRKLAGLPIVEDDELPDWLPKTPEQWATFKGLHPVKPSDWGGIKFRDQQTITALDWARIYVKRGWNPIPIGYMEKGPKEGGWDKVRVTPESVDKLFSQARMNIGVQLGPMSGGLTDADFDIPEARAAARYLMPPTGAVFGRKSNPNSHMIYYTDLCETQSKAAMMFHDPEAPPPGKGKAKANIMELRIGGYKTAKGQEVLVDGRRTYLAAQTVFPGSVHPSGEAVQWTTDEEPAKIDGAVLITCAKQTSAAALLARHYPEEGIRHNAHLAIAGMLARCEVPLVRARDFGEAVMFAAGQHNPDHLRNYDYVYKSKEEGADIYGLPKVKEYFDLSDGALKLIAELLGYPNIGGSALDGMFDKARAKGVAALREAIETLGVKLSHDDFSNRNLATGIIGFPDGELTDEGASQMRFLVEEKFKFLPKKDLFEELLSNMCYRNRFHPLKDYLEGLRWDDKKRIDSWLIDYAGAEDTPLNRAIGALFLTAAIRRVYEPGCKFDTLMVLESPQGMNKSQALAVLAVQPGWFSDNLPLDADSRSVVEQVEGKWFIEFAEMTGIRKKDIDHVKAFLSRQEDRARAAYARRLKTSPRHFVCVGTTNDNEYLQDDVNRRFWPVKIKKFDLDALRRDVDRLWAEAYQRGVIEKASITLDPSLWLEAAKVQEARRLRNPFVEILDGLFGEGDLFVMTTDAWTALGIKPENRFKSSMQFSAAFKELGFEPGRWKKADENRDKRGYVRGENPTMWEPPQRDDDDNIPF